jgi:hypothetical protein
VYLATVLIRGFFERRGRKGFAESAKEDKEKIKPKIKIKPKQKQKQIKKHQVNSKLRFLS